MVTSQYTSSNALGEGLRLGFLGQLHLEVFSQRLTSEFGTEITCTAPSVSFRAKLSSNLSDKNRKLYSGRIIEGDMIQFESLVESYLS